ncbi:hypothetical protein GDO86_001256 [Hymenochirus boettgeri]|uniref:Uncharacterized protein n=1 Tax=Hymenochirus boettgeri TaxID=247094 RepID=A0A8T2KKP2_9PIPI|nr:hypothetical protein GDO86_001256 [Hymenochirus boettgeri]
MILECLVSQLLPLLSLWNRIYLYVSPTLCNLPLIIFYSKINGPERRMQRGPWSLFKQLCILCDPRKCIWVCKHLSKDQKFCMDIWENILSHLLVVDYNK